MEYFLNGLDKYLEVAKRSPYRNLHLVKAKGATHALDHFLHVVIGELARLKQLLGQGKLCPASLQVQQAGTSVLVAGAAKRHQ